MEFKVNQGPVDRATRGLLALVTLAFGVTHKDTVAGKLLLGVAGLLGLTSVTGVCPAYLLLDVDTTEACTVANIKSKARCCGGSTSRCCDESRSKCCGENTSECCGENTCCDEG